MKKLFSTLILIFILSFLNCIITLAATQSKTEDSNFSITSGIDLSEQTKTTFDQNKTITGYAPVGSTISITVYEKLPDKKEKLNLIENYSIIVGSTGYFNQSINLNVGENIININVLNDKKTIDSVSTTIKRKKSEIKNELEQGFNLPRTRR